jgi:hypothetical protein
MVTFWEKTGPRKKRKRRKEQKVFTLDVQCLAFSV